MLQGPWQVSISLSTIINQYFIIELLEERLGKPHKLIINAHMQALLALPLASTIYIRLF